MRKEPDPIFSMSDQEPGDCRQECPRSAPGVLCCLKGVMAKVEGARCALGCFGLVLWGDLRHSTWIFLGTVLVWQRPLVDTVGQIERLRIPSSWSWLEVRVVSNP